MFYIATLQDCNGMGLRQRDWARRTVEKLRLKLGNCCANCGVEQEDCEEYGETLHMDCIIPQGDKHHKQEWSARVSFYRRQDRLANLQLLCVDCHILKNRWDRQCPDLLFLAEMTTTNPF